MRVIFCGSGDFGLPSLKALCDAGHELIAVFTQPDRPSGRGRRLHRTEVCRFAMEHGLAVHQPPSLKPPEIADLIRSLTPDLGVVVAYGHLIPPAMLAAPCHGFVNLHASLLPKYRGAAPVPHAILNGEKETGVTVFRLNERFDEGDILTQVVEPILTSDTSATLLKRLAAVGAKLLVETIAGIAVGSITPRPQTQVGASRAPRLRKEDGLIPWHADCVHIDRMVRAFQPWPLAFTFFPGSPGNKQRVAILAVERANSDGQIPSPHHPPGAVLLADAKRGIVVQCGDGCLRLTRLKPEGRGEMSDIAYMCSAAFPPDAVLA